MACSDQPDPPGVTGDNPLFNEDVLEVMLGYLDFDNLKQCRSVNSLWNLVTNRVFSPKCGAISFVGSFELDDLDEDGYGIEDMKRFIKLLDTSWAFPCTKFIVDCDMVVLPHSANAAIGEDKSQYGLVGSGPCNPTISWTGDNDKDKIKVKTPNEDELTLIQFFEKVGPWITDLTINDGADDNEQLFKERIPTNIQYTNLKTLEVKIKAAVTSFKKLQSNMEFVGSILGNAPNVQSIYLDTCSNARVVSAALSVFSKAPCSKIRDFSLKGDIEDKHLTKIVDMGMTKLKNLTIKLTELALVTSEGLQGLLEYQSDTLKVLDLECLDFERLITVELPRLPKLKELIIKATYSFYTLQSVPLPGVAFANVNYARNMPSLKRLVFTENLEENLLPFFHDGIQPVDTVKELEFAGEIVSPEIILNAARIFPKLSTLAVPSQVIVIRAVYEAFTNVEELTISYGQRRYDSVDQVLTGYSHEDCVQIHCLSSVLFGAVNRGTEPEPFLNKLKVLNINAVYSGDHVVISDLSCKLVLIKLRNLKVLRFNGGRPSLISEQMVSEMRERFSVQYKEETEACFEIEEVEDDEDY